MTRRDVFKGIAAFAACGKVFGEPWGAVLVVVRLAGGSDLVMLRDGAEIARVRITVIDPEVMNDVELAECMRLGLKALGEGDLPLFLADGAHMTGITRIV
jgi:hypothetical protein